MFRLVAVSLVATLFCSATMAAEPASINKLVMAPKTFKGKEVSFEASLGMVIAQKLLSQCKKKQRAFMVLPPMVPGGMVAPPTVQIQVCLEPAAALELVDKPAGTNIMVTGIVRPIKTMTVFTAIAIDSATVTVP